MIRLASLFEVDTIWPHIAEGMREACDRGAGSLTADEMFQNCRRGFAYLFVIEQSETGIHGKRIMGALVGKAVVVKQERVFDIDAVCGKGMETWLEELRGFSWPQDMGFSRVVFEGRKGWERVVPGVRVIRQVYEVDLSNG